MNKIEESRRSNSSGDSAELAGNNEVMSTEYQSSRLPYYFGLFLISPVLALLSGMFTFSKSSAKIIIILFVGVVGYTIIINPGADSETLMLTFLNHYRELSFSGFLNELYLMITLQSTGIIIDEPFFSIVSFGVSRFTENPRWLFAVAGVLYGYFFVKGISLVTSEIKSKWYLPIIILFVLFISWVTVNGVYAPRNFTAAWVLFCGTFLYYKTRNNKYLFLVLLAPLIHIAYSVIMLPFFAYLGLGNRKYLFIAILAVSFFASAQMSFLEPVLTSTELGQTKMNQYTGDHWDQRLEEEASKDKSFHAEYYSIASDLSIQIMFLFCILFAGYLRDRNHDHFQNALAGVAILLLAFSNFVGSVIPVLGNRLFLIFALVALAYLIRLYSQNHELLISKKWVIYLCSPAILLFLFTQWSIVGNMLDFKILFSPLLYPFIGDDPVSIKSFLRQLLGV